MGRYWHRFWRQVGWLWLCPLARWMPRDDGLWVFGAWHGRQYSDNAHYLFRHVRAHEPGVRAVWLAHDPAVVRRVREEGGEAELAYSLRGTLIALRAGVALVTHNAEDVNAHATVGALLVNLTHGTPLKRMGRDARSRRLGRLTAWLDRHGHWLLPGKRRPSLMVVASGVAQRRMMSAYDLPAERVLALGYPRWEAFREDAAAMLRRVGIEPRDHAGLLLYAPTLREQGQGTLDVDHEGGLAALRPWLERERLMLLVRGHVSLRMQGGEGLFDERGRIREVPADRVPDVNVLLPAVDGLITDYSSVMFDYACLERPVILMAPDLDDYRRRDVGLYGDYLAEAPGPVIADWSRLPAAWGEVSAGRHAAHLAAFTTTHGEYHDGLACQRIVAVLRRRLPRVPASRAPESAPGEAPSRAAPPTSRRSSRR